MTLRFFPIKTSVVLPSTALKSFVNTLLGCLLKVSNQGCILNLKSYFLPPPPSWFIFFPQLKSMIMRGARCRRKIVSLFLQLIIFYMYIFSQKGKKYAYFLPIGGKICISSPFLSPFNHFFPPTSYLAIFLSPPPWVKQKNIHPCFN